MLLSKQLIIITLEKEDAPDGNCGDRCRNCTSRSIERCVFQNSIAAMEKEREKLDTLGTDATDDTKKKIETRLLNDRQELKALSESLPGCISYH